jgi:hypothetical protein
VFNYLLKIQLIIIYIKNNANIIGIH